MKSIYLVSLIAVASASARTVTVKNACSFTIWPALFTDPSLNSAIPSQPTGWEAAPNTQVSFTVPETWTSGRIWGRRYCNFTTTGEGSCLDGGLCSGGLLCDPRTGTAGNPATLAEITFHSGGDRDFYDVSIVDAFNLPMRIDTNKGCSVQSCPVDLIPNCPSALKGPLGPTGLPIGCNSACLAGIGGNPDDSPACCTGSYSIPSTCPPSKVPYYSFFKSNCPRAITFPYDEVSGSISTTGCSSDLKADYTVTFCP
ncbi:hypothetical protein CVT24_000848 [Panaeolus cyanescens]|uniref:Thaumatin-like protein n=1 Tax=Panaeolus cyanescens TaxID=181874 RepID=A0A409VVJ2_9AGAR|nr:hypothetical protein CVT24_000848 [Panaeolus cyanescens]